TLLEQSWVGAYLAPTGWLIPCFVHTDARERGKHGFFSGRHENLVCEKREGEVPDEYSVDRCHRRVCHLPGLQLLRETHRSRCDSVSPEEGHSGPDVHGRRGLHAHQ